MKTLVNRGSAGIDGQSIQPFTRQLGKELDQLPGELQGGRYTPLPVRRCWIPKLGSPEKRPLGIPAVRDRIVEGAVRNVIEPIFERAFAEHSYEFRPGRGCQDARRRVDDWLRAGKTWVVDLDFKAYFDTIPHDQLMARVEELISDGKLLALLRKYLKAGVMDGLKGWEDACEASCGGGLEKGDGDEEAIISDGPMPALRSSGTLVGLKPGAWRCNLTEKLPFWRAVCDMWRCRLCGVGGENARFDWSTDCFNAT